MKTLENIKIGNFIKIKDSDDIIKKYLSSGIFTGVNIRYLKIICNISESKKYKVISICKSCKKLTITTKNRNVPIRFENIKEVIQ